MSARIREELDSDRFTSRTIPTRLRTDLNTQIVSCSACGDAYYVDQETFDLLHRAMGFDPDNQFTCPRCEDEEEVDSRR